MENYKGAISDLTEVIKNQPNNADAYLQRGNARIESDDCLGAIEDFTQVIKINPHNAIPFLCRGEAYIVVENYRKCC